MQAFQNLINLYDLILDYFWDLFHGTNTRRVVEVFDLLPQDTKHLGNAKKYQAVRTRVLRKTLAAFCKFDTASNYKFIDLGSGKGRTLIWAKRYGFKDYLGVDFSDSLTRQAKSNHDSISYGEFITSDVLDVFIKDEPTVFFMFNPFDSYVLKNFLKKFHLSPSDIYFIYVNPISGYLFELFKGYNLVKLKGN